LCCGFGGAWENAPNTTTDPANAKTTNVVTILRFMSKPPKNDVRV